MSSPLILRIQSSDGTKRIEISPSETACDLFEKVFREFNLDSFEFSLYQNKGRKNEILSSRSRKIDSLNLKHGDVLYLESLNGAFLFNNNTTNGSSSDSSDVNMATVSGTTTANSSLQESPAQTPTDNGASIVNLIKFSNIQVTEDEIDQQLWKLNGKIQRVRDPKFCHHGANACCVHCSPLEPFDESYMKEHSVKHMSFHTYLRKLTAGVDRGKFVLLEDVSCRIKDGCTEHLPWPKGICSKCQPSAITLNRQTYRHVDHVMFENSSIVDTFLNYWRITGLQRAGILLGRYEIHSDVPLGIRAVVAAIYELPQEAENDSITLLPDTKQDYVEQMAVKLGLQCVGWIFTDLVPEDVQKGTVKWMRGMTTYFLSAQECIMAGHFQNLHPNPCRFSTSGYFGSKFVTVCVTGDATNQIHMEGYSVSNQCMALVREGILLPTVDAPELGFIRESSDKQYVPDVYYKATDSYGNEVTKLARPLPVEYLLVDVPTSKPLTPRYTFPVVTDPFPIENRSIDGHIQDFNTLANYFMTHIIHDIPTALSDFHLLLYLATNDIMPLQEYMDPLLEAIKNEDINVIVRWTQSEHWQRLEQLLSAGFGSRQNSSPLNNRMAVDESSSDDVPEQRFDPFPTNSEPWVCAHCTYLNTSNLSVCDMCSLPR